jgi:hypothetical protein
MKKFLESKNKNSRTHLHQQIQKGESLLKSFEKLSTKLNYSYNWNLK